MAPNVPGSQIKLSYPLYAADFDPFNPDFLLVGGGGGSSSTGVPNKISLIDTSRRDRLTEVVDIDLAKNEDSVTSLAVGDASSSSLTAFAGINSSVADQGAGKNEHLRSFRIGLPAKRKADGTLVGDSEKQLAPREISQAISRAALFKAPTSAKSEAYQRVLRLSSANKPGKPRLAAIASGLAQENELVVFRPSLSSGTVEEVSRIDLGRREAADLDLIGDDEEDAGYLLGYCTDEEVFVQLLPASTKPEVPVSLHRTPESTTNLPPLKRPKFRALRFLSPRHILLLQNRPGRTGADLLILRISKDLSQARISLRKRLHKSTKAAVGLDVAPLSESQQGEKQFVVAVAGQSGDESSIEVLTAEYSRISGIGAFREYTLLKNVHSGPLTRVVFSNFIGPQLPVTKETGPQSIRLASVGVDQTVVVHRLALRPYPTHYTKTPRYVLTPPGTSESVQTSLSVLYALAVIGIAAFIMQVFSEIRGAVPPFLGAPDWLSPGMREKIAHPYMPFDRFPRPAVSDIPIAAHSASERVKSAASHVPGVDDIEAAASELKQTLKNLVEENSELETPKAIIVREADAGEISTEVLHHDADLVKLEVLRKWEELSEAQKKSWKSKLIEAGHWAEHQGETILKGILFSELAGAVGNMVGG